MDNKKWVRVEVEAEITVPGEGLFIVFENLGDDFYNDRTIWSKVGRIDAAPTINGEIYNPRNPHKSYIYSSCFAHEDCDSYQWQPIKCHFGMDVEYKSN